MDADEFRRRGYEMVDYIADYHKNIRTFRVTPKVEPGYLFELIPHDPPEEPESWEDIMNDLNTKIMHGMTHWQHPNFHAYFPVGVSYPSILGDLFAGGTANVGFSWASNPVGTELECMMVDWLAQMLGLPEEFLFLRKDSKGGGVIQNSASECVLMAMLAARYYTMEKLKKIHPTIQEGVLLSKLMAYCSEETHSCAEKAAMIAFVKIRVMETDEKFKLRGETFIQAVEKDKAMGFIPFFLILTIGTTSSCACDPLHEFGPTCKEEDIWMHVDAAYGGAALICPEFRYLIKGIEYADSFNVNPAKWILTTFDTTVLWFRDCNKVIRSMTVNPKYLTHDFETKSVDFRHWEIPLGRKIRAAKLWFVIRNYGVSGIQKYLRESIRLAKVFEALVREDKRFEVVNEVVLGLVCFRLNGSNLLNEKLLSAITQSRKLFMVPATLHKRYVIRFGINYEHSTEDNIRSAWKTISRFATDLLKVVGAQANTQMEEKMMSKKEVQEEKSTVFLREKGAQELVRYKRTVFVRMACDMDKFSSDVVSHPSSKI